MSALYRWLTPAGSFAPSWFDRQPPFSYEGDGYVFIYQWLVDEDGWWLDEDAIRRADSPERTT